MLTRSAYLASAGGWPMCMVTECLERWSQPLAVRVDVRSLDASQNVLRRAKAEDGFQQGPAHDRH
ncbi:hypothetical protein AVO44_16340 [Ruegeria profundi]|uniref:Uncharacterized protein n=1 Tax=Ruegeria profundi TaxID=1685378 RepID=A0A0X3TP06_9RHOB|nr:hypothetical protein AVO44_16340 [Ruegeria profundi]